MMELIWDFGALDDSQEADYVKALLDQFAEQNSIFERLTKQEVILTTFSGWICAAQSMIRKITGNVASVSQRDFQRVFKLISYFYHKKKEIFGLIETKQLKKPRGFSKMSDSDILDESVILAIAVAYYLRLPSTQKDPENSNQTVKPRDLFEQFMNTNLTLRNKDKKFRDILDDEMSFYLEEMRVPGSIAKNDALKENIFAIVVCVANKYFFFKNLILCNVKNLFFQRMPLLINGQPGSSKTISMNVSKKKNFCRDLEHSTNFNRLLRIT